MKKETKRRGDMGAIFAKQLPTVAVAIATENDEEEIDRDAEVTQCFARIPELIQRHMKKVEAEVNKFIERCEK